MSGFALGDVRNGKTLRPLTRGLGLAALCVALSGCYYYVPPTTQLACVPTGAPPAAQGQYYQAPPSQPAPAPQGQGQPPAAGGCPDGMAASYVQTPGYTAPYGYGYGYGYPYGGYPYPGYGYPDYGYPGYGYPGYGYGYGYGYAPVEVGFGFGYRGHWGGRWR